MRIAHIVNSFPPYFGGMGNVVLQTAVELGKRGHDVVVFTPQYFENKEVRSAEAKPARKHSLELTAQIENVKRLSPSMQYGNAARLPQLSKELNDFDLVHFHYPFFGTANIIRRWKLKNINKPLVITYHMDPRGLGWKGLIFKLYAKYYSEKILGIADKIIATSFDYIENSEIAGLFKNMPDKWVEIPLGVDIYTFEPREKSSMLLEKYDLNPNLPIVLFVGGMDPAHYFKGVPILLEALLLLKRKNMFVQAILVGDGEMKSDFELRAQGYGLRDLVKFTGRVESDDLPYYYNLGDLFVLPSIHKGEAFGMVLLEAMASGVPVLASDLPGVRTVVSDGGRVFATSDSADLAEAIQDYFTSNSANQLAWRDRARKVVEKKYSWDKIIDQIEDLYNGLIK